MHNSKILGIHCANPHYYDYIHSIELKENGSFIFMTGAGQCPGTDVLGKWHIKNNSLNQNVICFSSITEVSPFDKEDIIQEHEDYEVEFILIEKETSFRCEVVWHVYSEKDWPAIIYPFKIQFSEDPIASIKGQDTNLYHMLESKDFAKSQTTFYPTNFKIDTNFHDLKNKKIGIVDLYEGKDVLSKKSCWKLW